MLAEQLSIGRELTQKIKQVDSDDEENEENEAPLMLSNNDKRNPWMNSVKVESEIDEFIKTYRKYWDEKHQKFQRENVTDHGSKTPVKDYTLDNGIKKRADKSNKTGIHLFTQQIL